MFEFGDLKIKLPPQLSFDPHKFQYALADHTKQRIVLSEYLQNVLHKMALKFKRELPYKIILPI